MYCLSGTVIFVKRLITWNLSGRIFNELITVVATSEGICTFFFFGGDLYFLNLYFVTVLLKRYIFFPKAKEVRVENDGLWGVGLERMKGWKG